MRMADRTNSRTRIYLTPTVGSEDVLVRVKACALNHLDIWIRQGMPAYPIPLPHVSGCDAAKDVEQVGNQVDVVTVGQRVILSPGISCWKCEQCIAGRDNLCRSYGSVGAMTHGGYAEYVKVPFRNVLPVPEHLKFEQAAAFPCVGDRVAYAVCSGRTPTWRNSADHGRGRRSRNDGGPNGEARRSPHNDHRRSDDKIPKAVTLGADAVINHAKEKVDERVKLLTEGRGVDVVIEHIGPEVWDTCLHSLRKGGRLITCGATTGTEVKLDLRSVYSRQLTIKGSYMGTRAELVKAAELMGQGRLISVIDRTFPLQEARAAQELMLSRKFFGKIVLTV